MTTPELIKVCLTNRGEDAETPWAEDLGPAPGPRGSRKVRLVNVPVLHAKPTYGDIVVVSPVEDGLLTWDRDGVAWPQVSSRIAEDGGRWAMIIDYAPHDDATGDQAFQALAKACEDMQVICEGAWGPDGQQPGRAYLAVDSSLTAANVMDSLGDAALPARITQIHPAPAEPGERPAKAPAKKPAVKATAKKPAAKKAAAKKPAKKAAAKKPTAKAAKKPAKKVAAKTKRRK